MERIASHRASTNHPPATVRTEAPLFFQPKLTVNEPGDMHEQEADAMADRVMRMASDPSMELPGSFRPSFTPVQRKCAHCEEEEKLQRFPAIQRKCEHCGEEMPAVQRTALIQRKCAHCEEEEKSLQRNESSTAAVSPSSQTESYIGSLNGKGSSLSQSERDFYEPKFGYDFSSVRLHTDTAAANSAKSLNAHAYTHGNNIVFGANQYQSDSTVSRKLMAHELTHVVQQNTGLARKKIQRQDAPSTPTALSSCRIHFRQGTTEFTDAREFAACMASIRSYLAANPDGNVVLHGYASEEGTPDFNLDLSRRRSQTVLRLLRSGRVDTTRIRTEGHGEDTTYPTREENRRVEIVMSREVTMDPESVTVPRPAPPPAFLCGPNVTTQVSDALSMIRTRFGGWTNDQKVEACDALDSLSTGGMAWDIVELHNNAWILGYRPACASAGATPLCGSTVQINSGCHYAGSANYVVFGAMCKLCADHFLAHGPINTGYARFTRRAMMDLINLYKGTGFTGLATPAGNFRESQAWAGAGYAGWPAAGTPAPDRSNCSATCPTPYSGSAFRVNWYPRQMYTGSSPIIPPEDAATP